MENSPANPSHILDENGKRALFVSDMIGDERITILKEFEFSILEFPDDEAAHCKPN